MSYKYRDAKTLYTKTVPTGAQRKAELLSFGGASAISGRLPSAYQEVEYIESHGTEYILTNYTPVPGDDFVFDCMNPNSSTSGGYFGAGNEYYSRQPWELYYAGYGYYNFLSSAGVYLGSLAQNSRYIFDFSADGTLKWYKDGTLFKTKTDFVGVETGVPYTPLYVFKTAYDDPASFRLYSCKITGKLDLVPCYRIADSVIGLYDLVSGTFYTNSGTGAFTKGNDIPSSLVHSTVTSIVSKDSENTVLSTLSIPSAVQALPAYGVGMLDGTAYNAVDLEHMIYRQVCEVSGSTVVMLSEPVETDISQYLDSDLITVEAGGSVTFVNAAQLPPPSTIIYTIDAVGGEKGTQVYAGSSLVYDSRLPDLDLLGLTVTAGVNKGGSATITMPPGHPAYNSFVSYKTIVTIYRDGVLIFRGRPLYPTDDFLNRRTITCEGERCFLRDAVARPYDYQDSPANVFTSVIGAYNAQVEAAKRFVVGTITVTDPNDYIRLYTETAEQISDTVDKLVERCGGYIVFTTNLNGDRVINWYASRDYQSTQEISFGENLLDFSRSANTDLATRIIPYGAKDETTGERLDITSVTTGGVDYVEDAAAVAIRGVIAKAVYWDDVTVAANLKAKAEQYLATSKMIVTTLTISAVDLAWLGEDYNQFRVGDNVHVVSAPHSVSDWMLLEDLTVDLMNPAGSTLSLGKSYLTLTGADVAGNRESQSELERAERSIKADYTVGIAQATTNLSSLIQQTSEAIQLMVSETYATNDELQSAISTQITQLADSVTLQFTQLRSIVDENDAEGRTQWQELRQYVRFEDGNIILGEDGNEITLKIENDVIHFLSDGAEVAYFTNRKLYVTDGEFLNSLKLGKFAFMPRENGNLSFKKVVD